MNKEQTENKKLSKETILNTSSLPEDKEKNKRLDITDITDITYFKKTITSIPPQSKNNIRTTIYLPGLLRDSSFSFADFTHKSFTQLVVDALTEYMINHKGDLNVENFTLNVVQIDQTEKAEKEAQKRKEKADKQEMKELERENDEIEKEVRRLRRHLGLE